MRMAHTGDALIFRNLDIQVSSRSVTRILKAMSVTCIIKAREYLKDNARPMGYLVCDGTGFREITSCYNTFESW